MRRSSLFLALVLTTVGCAHYEYDVLQPHLKDNRVGTKEDLTVAIDPLRYELRSVDNRLVVRIGNPTSEVIEVVGVRSAVVDPAGQARPVRSQPIPPGAFMKLILPPVRPEYVASGGPRLGYSGGIGPREFGYTQWDPPVEYTLRDGGETYWDWRGETNATLTLVFKQAGKEFTHTLAFSRVKVK